ncbi:MAG TPA: CPBP family intramembrane metalloprotease [Pseudomonadota bacterium]|nr:CPBP family intramembrane metalloprotease [Pseudomonadota bacterium]
MVPWRRAVRVLATLLGAGLVQAALSPLGWARPAGLLWLRGLISPRLVALPDASLRLQLRWLWALSHAVGYLLLPLLLAAWLGHSATMLGLRRSASSGRTWTIWRSLGWTVAVFVLLVLPTALVVSQSPVARAAYPMYQPAVAVLAAPAPWLWAVLAMALYLLAIEVCFRGVVPAILEPAVGTWPALALSLLPYVATHTFWPETVAAVPFGVLLSYLRWRSGTIWLGFVVHFLLATSLELVGLAQHGVLAGR